jgi:hypothetical protein
MIGPDGGNNAYACDGMQGNPCGWSPTPFASGYTCGCRHPAWADPWTCEPATTPDADSGVCP